MFQRCFLALACLCFVAIGNSQPGLISCTDKHIQYEGRIWKDGNAMVLTWPGVSVRINFHGTGLSVIMKDQDTANYYNVIVDGNITMKIHTDTAKHAYTLAAGLTPGDHNVELFKRTEWDKGKTWFYGILPDNGTSLLAPPALKKRRIEFFGNSITCGYATEDMTGDSPTGYYENNYVSYAAITARHFNAQYYCSSKSGIGILISWFPLIMREMYDRMDPTDSTSKWDFSKYTPDLVIINLFQNDAWLTKMKDNAQFKAKFGTTPPDHATIVNAYKSFVQIIRSKYPKAQIICCLGSMDATREGSPWPGYVQEAVHAINDKNIFTLFFPYKNTPGHPKVAEQKVMADTLIDFIEKNIEW
jgi:hypothetical protein